MKDKIEAADHALLEGVSPTWLRYLIEIETHASYAQAAQALDVDKSNISRGISSLERKLGLGLVNRKSGSRHVSLNTAGRSLLPEARRLVAAAGALDAQVEGIKRGEEGIIAVACYPVHISRFMAAAIAAFRDLHPHVRVDLSRMLDPLSETTYKERFDMLEVGRVDLAVGPPQPDRDFEWIELYRCNIVVAASATSSLRGRRRIRVSEVKGERILIAPAPYPSRMIVEDACNDAGFTLKGRVEVESTNPVALLALSDSGLGLPLVPDDHPPIGRRENPYPRLVDEKDEELVIPVHLHWRPTDHIPENVAEFIDCAKSLAKQEKQSPFSTAINLLS